MKSGKTIRRIVMLLVIGLAVVAAFAFMKPAAPAVQYRTETVTKGDILEVVSANGTLNPTLVVDVGTQTSGKITGLYAHQNDIVTKGQLLAEIDPSLLQAQLRQSQSAMETAKLGLDQAENDMKRMRALVEKDYIARADLEKAELGFRVAKNGYDSAKAQVERDQINLGYAKVTAPIDGVIIDQTVSEGQTMAANFQTPSLFKIARDLAKMKIDVSLPESDVGKVKKGLPVTFTVDAFPDRQFKGGVALVNINPDSQQGVVTYKVSVDVDNPDRALVPGMTAMVSIIVSQEKDVLRVPVAALRFSPPKEDKSGGMKQLFSIQQNIDSPEPEAADSGRTLYLLKNGAPERISVKTGVTDDAQIAVSGPKIAAGDKVVIGIVAQPQ